MSSHVNVSVSVIPKVNVNIVSVYGNVNDCINVNVGVNIDVSFNVSPCIFQFNNWQTPTHALHIQQYISLECWFQCLNT